MRINRLTRAYKEVLELPIIQAKCVAIYEKISFTPTFVVGHDVAGYITFTDARERPWQIEIDDPILITGASLTLNMDLADFIICNASDFVLRQAFPERELTPAW